MERVSAIAIPGARKRMTKTVIILAAGTQERWTKNGLPKQLLNIGGESLLARTVRQVKTLGSEPIIATHHPAILSMFDNCMEPEARRWTVETLLSTRDYWAERTIILLGDVIWPNDVLAGVLNSSRRPGVFGNCQEIFAMTFVDHACVQSAARYVISEASTGACRGKIWNIYHALAGFEILTGQHWNYGVFEVVSSQGTPANGLTQDFDTPESYEDFLKRNPWACTTQKEEQ